MAKKVSKNQRTARGGETRAMAKIVVAEKKANGQYRFKEKVVEASQVQTELQRSRS